MAIVLKELKAGTRSTTSTTGLLRYSASGSTDDAAIRTHVESNTPTTYNGLPRQDITINTLGKDDWWLVEVMYSRTSNAVIVSDVGESRRSFNTSGETVHITSAITEVNSYAPPGETAPDFNGALGVSSSGVEGIDIVSESFSFTITKVFPGSSIDIAYEQVVAGMTGRTNNATFSGYAAGELLLVGVNGSERDTQDGSWELSFDFKRSPNVTGQTIGDITGIAKKGHEYLEVQYKDIVDDTSKTIAKTPTSVHVYQVYKSGDFSALGL